MTILTLRLSSVAEAAGSGGHQEKRLVVQGAGDESRFARQTVGIKEVRDDIWRVSLMD
jgi:hypothetical protein